MSDKHYIDSLKQSVVAYRRLGEPNTFGEGGSWIHIMDRDGSMQDVTMSEEQLRDLVGAEPAEYTIDGPWTKVNRS